MSTRCLSIIAVVIAALWAPALAAQVDALYDAAVPVRDQSADARRTALREALGVVLVRVTGDRQAPARETTAAILDAAPRLVQQFRYEQREIVDPETGAPRRQLFLAARFDGTAIQGALRERGIAVWGRERPSTVVWLAFDDGFERGFVDASAPPGLAAAAVDAAAARGLPLVWPLLDLEDRAALPFTDLWGGFDERIAAASERYRSNAVLVGRVYRVDAERWAARWTLTDDEGSRWTDTGPGALPEVTAEGVHWVADHFARRFALDAGVADGRTRVVVTGVATVGDYAGIMRYLASLSPVSHVALDTVERDEVTFAVELRGTPEQFRQAVALGRRLTPEPAADPYDASLRFAIRR